MNNNLFIALVSSSWMKVRPVRQYAELIGELSESPSIPPASLPLLSAGVGVGDGVGSVAGAEEAACAAERVVTLLRLEAAAPLSRLFIAFIYSARTASRGTPMFLICLTTLLIVGCDPLGINSSVSSM